MIRELKSGMALCNDCIATCSLYSLRDKKGIPIPAHCSGERFGQRKPGTFKFWELALSHPTSMNAVLSQFPAIKLKHYIPTRISR